MNIGIASDHRGYKLKQKLIKYLNKRGYQTMDFGTTTQESVDYPNFGFLIGESVMDKTIDFGIVICGTGIGISIACNKVPGIRCAKVDNTKEAKHCIIDNNANVVALNGSMLSYKAYDIIDVLLKTKYTGEERHEKRIQMITAYEKNNNKKVSKKEIIEEFDN